MAVIYGTTSSDNKTGTTGNDTIYGWALSGNASSPSGNDTLNGNAGNDKLYGGTGNDSLYGGLGVDTLYGGLGNDGLQGSDGNDKLYSEAGDDTLSGGTGNDSLYGGADNDTLNGDNGNDCLIGDEGNDQLDGQAGNDTLNGGSGNDTLIGGTGNDTYIIDSTIESSGNLVTDSITEATNSGTDTVRLTIQDLRNITPGDYVDAVYYGLGTNVENLTITGSGIGIVLEGNGLDNIILGGNANNYYIDQSFYSGDRYGLNGGDGNDTLYGEAGNDRLAGDSGNDSLLGGSGNDTLNGGSGNDTLIGGTGNDLYYIDSTSDTVIESFNQGIDTVYSAFNYILGENSNLENLYLSSNNAISGTGNSLDNYIYGNDSDNYLYGLEGNDYLASDNNSFYYQDQDFSDDYLDGGAGNDSLYGGTGSDSLYGGLGNDVLDSESESTYLDYGSDSLNGGLGDDVLQGGYGSDTLTGDDGNDFLSGGYGSDTLTGGNGNDTLNGGYDSDTLTGGTGMDTFDFSSYSVPVGIITDFVVADDTIRVFAFGSDLTVGAAITAAQFTIGSAARDASVRFIYNQNTGVLFFDSDGTGASEQVQLATLSTGLAMTNADIFVFGEVNGGNGNDTLSGGNGNDTLEGNDGNDRLYGGNGNDTLEGGDGSNTLAGGAGTDIFDFDHFPSDSIANITDFVVADDTIRVYAPNFGGGLTAGAITAAQFTIGSVAVDKSDRFIYNQKTGALFFDSDGTGATAQVQLASLSTNLAMTNADIFVVGYSDLYGTKGNDDSLFGGEGNNSLYGEGGNDTLSGGNGNDTLTGGADADTFFFTSPDEGIDNITDFVVADDTIRVSPYNFGSGLTADAAITPAQFVIGSAARDQSDRFIYNQNTGALFFDADGTGATVQVQLATLSPGLAMTNNDIFVIQY